MSRLLERAVFHAAEAAIGHYILVSKMAATETALLEDLVNTISKVILGHIPCVIRSAKSTEIGGNAEQVFPDMLHHRHDVVVVEHNGIAYPCSLVVASRFKLTRSLDVTSRIEHVQLLLGHAAHAAPQPKPRVAYMLVMNLQTDDSHPGKPGIITWDKSLPDCSITCIATCMYRSSKMVVTASVFRVRHTRTSST